MFRLLPKLSRIFSCEAYFASYEKDGKMALCEMSLKRKERGTRLAVTTAGELHAK